MPKTRTQVPKQEKVDELVAAAERRLRSGGYEALSVAAIARELGIAQNAIYWYFPSKDNLFVAALERLLREIAARKPSRTVGEVERIIQRSHGARVVVYRPVRPPLEASGRHGRTRPHVKGCSRVRRQPG